MADDGALVRAAKNGDESAFVELIRRTQGSVRFFIAVRCSQPSEVDDVAQEVYVTAFRKLPSLDEPFGSFGAWLKGIAINLLRNRSRQNRPQLLADLRDLLDPASAQGVTPDPISDPIEALQECMKGLEARSGRLLKAKYVERLSLDEIAKTEGGNARAISVALVRVRKNLRACIETRLNSPAELGGQLS